MNRRHTLSVIVVNEPGVLGRVAGLFSRRGFNIESISVGETDNPQRSCMTIVTTGDAPTIEQLTKQLNKMVDVIKVVDLTEEPIVARELALIKVNCSPAHRAEIEALIAPFRADVVDVGRNALIIQTVGREEKVAALVELLRPYGIRELLQTGVAAMQRSGAAGPVPVDKKEAHG
ncbi:MAG: acetolactate synthase small subunit [Firmicutes bacterium]|nr:acetolactate synthase small subunit [Bacillota bacterium]